MSSARYLLGRWIAALSLTLFASAATTAAVYGACLADSRPPGDPATWLAYWALDLAPIVICATAAWLGATTFAGGEIGALAVCVIGGNLGNVLLNEVLFRTSRLVVDGFFTPFSVDGSRRGIQRLGLLVRDAEYQFDAYRGFSPLDFDRVAQEAWMNFALPGALERHAR